MLMAPLLYLVFVVALSVKIRGGSGAIKRRLRSVRIFNLGVSLAQQGKKVPLIDADGQANLTMSLGYGRPDDLSDTLSSIMQDVIDDTCVLRDIKIL